MSNPIKASNLYQDDGAIQEAIKQMEALRSVYVNNLDAITKEAEKLMDKLNQVNTTTKEGQETTRKGATDANKLKKAQINYTTALNDTNTKIRALQEAKRADIKTQKLQTKLANAAKGSYNQLSAQYAINKLKLNAMSKAQRSAGKTGKLLEDQTREIYNEMSRLQKVTGKHTLEVGNYGIATANLHPILGRVNMALGSMGTNLQALGAAKNPFKVLTTSIIAFGRATLVFLLSPVGLALAAVGALFLLISRNKDTVLDFNDGLINVGKTAGLSGEELRGLGNDIVELSRKLKVIGTPALLGYATVAGQLGVKGRDDILAFTEALAKLETTSDLAGEDSALQVARFLGLVDGGVQRVSDFGDEITFLGNTFKAKEKEILGNALAIAQNTGQYKIGRQAALSYAVATKAVGLEAELTGTSMGRTLALIEKAIRTGKGIDEVAELTGRNIENLKAEFSENSGAVFNDFVKGLNQVFVSGGSVNGALEEVGITSVRHQRVIATLATAGYGTLEEAIASVETASGSLDEEFGAASKKLKNQLARVGIAWDNLILTVEDGEGVFGQFGAFIAGAFADYLDHGAKTIKVLGALFSGLGNVMREIIVISREFFSSLSALGDIKIDFGNPAATLASFVTAISKVKNINFKDNFKRVGEAFTDGFENELKRVAKISEDAMKAASDAVERELNGSVKKSIKTIGEIDDEIARLNETLKGATSRGEAKGIQNDIKALEKKRNAILGVANANIKELESRALTKKKAVIDVMEEGESKDIAILEFELEEKSKLWKKFNLDIKLLEDFEQRQRFLIAQKWRDAAIKAEKAKQAKIAATKKKDFGDGKAIIDLAFEISEGEIQALKTTEAEKTRLRLEAEKLRLQKIIALNKQMGGQLTAVQVQQMKNAIAEINAEMKDNGEQKDIYDLIGLKIDSDQKAAISESVAFAIENVQAMLAARVEAADILLQKAQEETDSAQSRFDQEIEARNNGFANNVLMAQKELELKKKNEAKALKEKQKAQKAQELVDTAMQVSGLITSSVNIWKSLSGIPIVGTALAVAALAVMWGSFAASKIKAKSVAKAKSGQGSYEVLQGGSHSSGNDIPIGMKGKAQRTAEGGEGLAVIRKSSTKKYKNVLPGIINSLNKGTFEETYSNAFIPAEQMPSIINAGYDSVDLQKVEEDLSAIRESGEVQRYIDSEGRQVEVYKNVKRVYV